LIGKVVIGRTYDPETYEISLRQVTARVIDVGMATCRFWANDSQNPVSFPIDVLFCAPFNGITFDTAQVVRMPFYLLTEIQGASVDISLADLVTGPPTKFTTDNLEDFTEGQTATGGIVTRAKCPVIFWENSFQPRVVGFSDYLVCYPLISQSPLDFDSSSLLFFQEIKAEFINPTFTGPTGGTGGTAGGIQGLVAGPGIGISVVGATATVSNLFSLSAGSNISISGSYPNLTVSAIIPPPGPSFQYFIQPTAPLSPVNAGDRWFNTTTGSEFVWIIDGNSSQWVEIASSGAIGPTGPSGYSEFYYQANPPSPNPINTGARWIDSDNGIEYVWVFDGTSYVWMQPSQLGGIQYQTNSISTSTYSATFAYEYYGVIYTGGICTVTLPLGTSPDDEGKFIAIADEVGGISYGNRGIQVQGTGGQLINGETSVLMRIDRMSLTFMYRNNSWKTI
jgi:hypothetical protein